MTRPALGATEPPVQLVLGALIGDTYRGADKSLARPEWKKATGTENFDVRISYL